MHRRFWLVCGVVAAAVAGCDSAQIDTASDVEPPQVDEQRVLTIGLMLPETGFMEAEVWQQVFRQGAARERVLSEVFLTPPGKQSDAVRTVATHHLDALIVVADESDPALPAALSDLQAQKLPIVFLEKSVPLTGGVAPVVAQSPVEEDARRVVDATVADATKAGFPSSGPALILVNGPYDEKGRARVAAITSALQAKGVEIVPGGVFKGYMKEASEALQAVLEAHPDLAIVIAEEDQGARAAGTVRDNLSDDKKPFILAAFGDSKELRHMANFNLFVALVERDLEKQADTALKTAIALASGEQVEPHIPIKTRFSRSTAAPMRNPMPDVARQRPVPPGVPLKGRGEDHKQ